MDLVTGGAGFIGSHLVDALVVQGKEVRVIDNFSSGREEFLSHHEGSESVEVHRGDLLDRDEVMSAMEGIETVHHLAANPDIRAVQALFALYSRQGRAVERSVQTPMTTHNNHQVQRTHKIRLGHKPGREEDG